MMTKQDIYNKLVHTLPKECVLLDESLSKYTYTHTGGNADLFVTPTSYEETQTVIRFAREHNVPVTLLGNGSNLIVRDGGIRGIVLSLVKLTDITVTDTTITAQSGAAIIDVSRMALHHTLTGLEFACGIPGSVGGALFMNAGAYGGEVADVLASVIVLTEDGELLNLKREELELEYRNSSIATNKYIALEATFKLAPGEHEVIKAKMDELTFLRESKQPLEYPSCGSVFKRPPGYFAGKLIQDSGLQGKIIGGAQVSTKHAGFIVNINNATAKDYTTLIKFVQDTVKEKFGVDLETEVKIIGEE
ncbi:UDP-N-acetylmuramate dehydrogenase [Priestia taiwanensis]|uniref:UDP-N-acetylenolpyruvoylglucosamine reductase n=2 Tax=Priestia taiwanensis TaxID=1347902 RepID=A0A917ERS0_9BACI|nr:UDP-N-acetylmuramate dehydrogenase [Priestia taiwanensis]GGE83425.1 UDP-N-acetylenolpyruvoylglucosamine reductase 2 [Priestia taiwanensis]